MPITKCEVCAQVQELRSLAEGLLTRELPITDGELTYLVGIINFSDEFLGKAS
jgi:hypothetical protein